MRKDGSGSKGSLIARRNISPRTKSSRFEIRLILTWLCLKFNFPVSWSWYYPKRVLIKNKKAQETEMPRINVLYCASVHTARNFLASCYLYFPKHQASLDAKAASLLKFYSFSLLCGCNCGKCLWMRSISACFEMMLILKYLFNVDMPQPQFSSSVKLILTYADKGEKSSGNRPKCQV